MSSQESAAVNTQDVAARVGELTAQDWIEWLDSEQASVLGTEPDSLEGLFSPVDGETGTPVIKNTGQDVQEVTSPKRGEDGVPLATSLAEDSLGEQGFSTPVNRHASGGSVPPAIPPVPDAETEFLDGLVNCAKSLAALLRHGQVNGETFVRMAIGENGWTDFRFVLNTLEEPEWMIRWIVNNDVKDRKNRFSTRTRAGREEVRANWGWTILPPAVGQWL